MVLSPIRREEVQRLLAQKKYRDAAKAVADIAYTWPEQYRELVFELGKALYEEGNRYSSRGRPREDTTITWFDIRVAKARGQYRAAVYARKLVDDDELPVKTLVRLTFILQLSPREVDPELELEEWEAQTERLYATDIPAARRDLLPHADAFLRELKLSPSRIPRRGHKKISALKIAEKWNVDVKDVMEGSL